MRPGGRTAPLDATSPASSTPTALTSGAAVDSAELAGRLQAQAAQNTLATIRTELTMSDQGQTASADSQVRMDLRDPAAPRIWTTTSVRSGDQSSYAELIAIGTDLYLREAPDANWLRETSTVDPSQFDQALTIDWLTGGSAQVSYLGEDQLEGARLTHYALAPETSSTPTAGRPVEFWVDGRNRITRLRSVEGAITTMDYDSPVSITAPDPRTVQQ